MRDFENIDRYLNSIVGDIYEQPPDEGHVAAMTAVIQGWVSKLIPCQNVLDIGCGAEAIAQPMFEALNIEYVGISLGRDAITSRAMGRNVINMDFHFLDFDDDSFDLIFARHVAEHSPMPLIALMEWQRVCRNFLCLVVPSPVHHVKTGRNHYSVLEDVQWKFLMDRAGFGVIWEDMSHPEEYRYMAQKRTNK